MRTLLLFLLVLFSCSLSAQIYVDASANGNEDGSSWADAYLDFGDALDAAGPFSQVWVAGGVYTGSFEIPDRVTVFGGFPKGGGNPASRRPEVYKTILRGSGPVEFLAEESDHPAVVTSSVTDSQSVLNGFHIQGGGIGVKISNGSTITVEGCWVMENLYGMFITTPFGGSKLPPLVRNCVIAGNGANAEAILAVDDAIPLQLGGGIVIEDVGTDSDRVTFVNCTVHGNFRLDERFNSSGGLASFGGRFQLINCVFWKNAHAYAARNLIVGSGLLGSGTSTTTNYIGGGGSPGEPATIFARELDPAQCPQVAHDLRPFYQSPLINAGVSDPLVNSQDIARRTRTQDGTVDFGAYEHVGFTFVDAEAPGSQTGNDWVNAYKNLQDALTGAFPGEMILIARGKYFPDLGATQNDDDRSSTFELNGVNLYGGFPTGGGNVEDREPGSNVTLTGSIIPNGTAKDGAYHVVTATTGRKVVVSQCTIDGGYAVDGPNSKEGGGLLAESQACVHLERVQFTSNVANSGGALASLAGYLSLEDCEFSNNEATGSGGALFASGSEVIIDETELRSNQANSLGGAMHLNNGEALLRKVEVVANEAGNSGGGISVNGGRASLRRVLLEGNEARQGNGGGISSDGGRVFFNTSIVKGNFAGEDGGGFFQDGSLFGMSFSTVQGNRAGDSGGGGGAGASSTTISISKSIIAGNADEESSFTAEASLSTNAATTVSAFQGSTYIENWFPEETSLAGGQRMFFAAPLEPFDSPQRGGLLRPRYPSPVFDLVNDNQITEPEFRLDFFDFSGRPRGEVRDYGAYEMDIQRVTPDDSLGGILSSAEAHDIILLDRGIYEGNFVLRNGAQLASEIITTDPTYIPEPEFEFFGYTFSQFGFDRIELVAGNSASRLDADNPNFPALRMEEGTEITGLAVFGEVELSTLGQNSAQMSNCHLLRDVTGSAVKLGVRRCRFTSFAGLALEGNSELSMESSVFRGRGGLRLDDSDARLQNCLFAENDTCAVIAEGDSEVIIRHAGLTSSRDSLGWPSGTPTYFWSKDTASIQVSNSFAWGYNPDDTRDAIAATGSGSFNFLRCLIKGETLVGLGGLNLDGTNAGNDPLLKRRFLSEEPFFEEPVDALFAADLIPHANSPLINAGLPLSRQAETDFFGNPRIEQGTVDIGPYEHRMIFVDQNANGTGTGENWGDAFKSFGDIDTRITRTTSIHVAQGHYTDALVLPPGADLYGGYESEGGLFSSRNPKVYPTRLTTVTNTLNLPAFGEDNNFLRYFAASEVDGGELGQWIDGFQFDGEGTAQVGITVSYGRTAITRCQFEDSLLGPDPFFPNTVRRLGSAISFRDADGGLVQDCVFKQNDSVSGSGAVLVFSPYDSGRALETDSATFLFERCFFEGNRSSNLGGAVGGLTDSSFYFNDPAGTRKLDLQFHDCIFKGNEATSEGGAIATTRGVTAALYDCLLQGNFAPTTGGAISGTSNVPSVDATIFGPSSGTLLENCSLQGNRSTGISTVATEPDSTRYLNTVVWGNLKTGSRGDSEHIAQSPLSRFEHSVVEGIDLTSVGTGNLDGTTFQSNPRFRSPVDPFTAPTTLGDLRLTAGSPLLDAGSTDSFISQLCDAAGLARIVGGGIDIGALEGVASAVPGQISPELWASDADEDGMSYGVELFLGTNPLVADPGSPRALQAVDSGIFSNNFGSAPYVRFRWGQSPTFPSNSHAVLTMSPDLSPGSFRPIRRFYQGTIFNQNLDVSELLQFGETDGEVRTVAYIFRDPESSSSFDTMEKAFLRFEAFYYPDSSTSYPTGTK